MELIPSDLGEKWHVALVRQRALGASLVWKRLIGNTGEIEPAPRIGFLGKYWARGTDISKDAAAKTLPLSSGKTTETAWIAFALGFVFTMPFLLLGTRGVFGAGVGVWAYLLAIAIATSILAWGSLIALPRHNFRKLHNAPVAHEELEGILEAHVPGIGSTFGRMAGNILKNIVGDKYTTDAPDALETTFLQLARDVMQTANLSSETQMELRATLRSLGNMIAELPPSETKPLEDAADLAEDARILAERAREEPDDLIAASLTRQAEMLLQRARSANRTNLIMRQTRVLRQEFITQMEAIRASLPGLSQRSATGEAQFTEIAATVQNIAQQAHSTAEARAELDESLRRPVTKPTQDDTQTLRVGVR